MLRVLGHLKSEWKGSRTFPSDPALGASLLPPTSLMFWGRESHFPFARSLEFSGANTPPPIHMPRGSSLEE